MTKNDITLISMNGYITMTKIINASPEFGKAKSSKLNIHLATIDDDNHYQNIHPT